MVKSDRKRQRKLERRSAKRKERRRELIVQKNRGLAEMLEAASRLPVLHCRVTSDLEESGLGQVLISRELSHGNVAVAMFLVDRYCQGVKNAFGRIVDLGEYRKLLERLGEAHELEDWEPADARRLVEGAVAFAASAGFMPHPDYHRAKPIFGDIDAGQATRRFEYGHEGKPLFVQGPYDDSASIRLALATLREHCGDGNFHYILGGAPGSLPLEETDPVLLETLGEEYGDAYEEQDDEEHRA